LDPVTVSVIAAEPAGTFAGAIDETTGVAAEGELPPPDAVAGDEEPPPQPVKTRQKTAEKSTGVLRQRSAYLMRQGSLAGYIRGIMQANVQTVTLSASVRPVPKINHSIRHLCGLLVRAKGIRRHKKTRYLVTHIS
jgi:hypothetical protein